MYNLIHVFIIYIQNILIINNDDDVDLYVTMHLCLYVSIK